METQVMSEPRIVRGRVELWVPHNSGEIAFAPLTNLGTCREVGKEIIGDSERVTNQRIPTGDETASLIHVAYCIPEMKSELEYRTIRDRMRNWIYVFNRIGWTFAGKYVLQDLDAKGRSEPLNAKVLDEMLKDRKEISGVRFSRDGRVRFAPRETYKLGEHTPESLALDGGVIAEYGVEGARKLADVSKEFRFLPRAYGVEIKTEEEGLDQRVSALYDYYGGSLNLYGDCYDDDRYGCASGVWK